MSEQSEHNSGRDLPRDQLEPIVQQPMELDFLLGQELAVCFQDLDGVHEFKTCYGDVYKAVNALRDYARLLIIACEQWKLSGFHRALYEYHSEKLCEIAGKLQRGIGYDYDQAVARCQRKKKQKQKESDIGEDALVLAFRQTTDFAVKKEENTDVFDSPWETDDEKSESTN